MGPCTRRNKPKPPTPALREASSMAGLIFSSPASTVFRETAKNRVR